MVWKQRSKTQSLKNEEKLESIIQKWLKRANKLKVAINSRFKAIQRGLFEKKYSKMDQV